MDLLGRLKKQAQNVGNFASRQYDQVNIFDNGLSQETRQVQGPQRSVIQQATPIAKGIVRAPAQFLNTAAAQVPQLYYTATGNQEMQRAAAQNFGNTGGLFNVGTFYNANDANRGDLRTGLQKIGGGTLATAATIAPFARGGSVAIGRGTGPLLPKVPKLAGEGAAYGASYSTGQQLQDTGRVDPRQLLRDTALGTAGNVAVPFAMRGAGRAATAGASQAKQQLPKLVQTTKDLTAGNPRPFKNLSDDELGAISVFRQQSGQGSFMDENIYRTAANALNKLNIKTGDATAIDDVLGRFRTYESRKATGLGEGGFINVNAITKDFDNLKQKLSTAKTPAQRNRIITKMDKAAKKLDDARTENAAETMQKRRFKALNEKGFVRIPGGAKDPAPDLNANQKEFINDYAEMLEGMNSSGDGAMLVKRGDDYSRTTSNSPFYRQIYEEKGRPPTKQEWFNEARRDIESGRAAYGASEEFKAIQPTKKSLPPKSSKFAKTTVQKSSELSDQIKKDVRAVDPAYVPTTNKGRIDQSDALVKGGVNKAYTNVKERLNAKNIDDQTASDTIAVVKALDSKNDTASLQKATDLIDQLSEQFSKAGQTVQAASLLNNRTPQGLLYGAQKALKQAGIELTPEIQKRIKTLTDATKKFPVGSDARNRAVYDLNRYVNSKIPSGVATKAINVWRAGLLTAPTTTGGNILGNTGEALVRKGFVNPLATLIDQAFALKTGKRTMTVSGGYGKGVKEGAGKLETFIKTGYDERQALSKYDTKELNYGDSGFGRVLGGYVNGTYRLMSLADQPFWYGGRGEALASIAKAEALNKGLKGQDAKIYVADFMANPPKKAMEQATKEAKYGTFQNETALGQAASGLKTALRQKSDAAGAVADFVLPFTQVPSSIATRIIERTPIGLANASAREFLKIRKGGQFDQRAMSQSIANGLFGPAVFGVGYTLANNGNLTFGFPEDRTERELWEREGKQPYSVRIGDRWYSLNYLQPFGTLLAIGGEVANTVKDGGSPAESITRGLAVAGQSIQNQSFLKGVSGILEAADDPKRYAENYAENTAGSSVPNFVRSFARATDPVQRDPNGISQGFQNALPGIRQDLPEKQDIFGQTVPAKDNFANQYFNPLRPSKVRDDVVTSELRRLADSDNSVLPSQAKKNAFPKERELTDVEVRELNKRAGNALLAEYGQFMNTPQFAQADDATKKAALRRINDQVYGAVKAQYGAELGFNPDNNKLDRNQRNYIQTGEVNTSTSTGKKSLDLPAGMNNYDVQTLERFNGIPQADKDKIIRSERDAEFKLALAQFERDSKQGTLSNAQQLDRQSRLQKLQVGSQFDKDVRELYETKKASVYDFLLKAPNGQQLADQLLAYDKALYDAGISQYSKYRNGLAPAARTTRSSGGRRTAGGVRKGGTKGQQIYKSELTSAIRSTASTSRRVAKAKLPKIGNKRVSPGKGSLARFTRKSPKKPTIKKGIA